MLGFDADNRTDGMVWMDDATDVANLPTFAETNKLPMGTKAYNIDNGDVYILKSTGEWKKQD